MCGISGIINLKESADSFVEASSRFHSSRGPDHFGKEQDQNWLLTHTRLKVIDIQDRSNQPMFSASGKSAIVFNGEIFNHAEIAKELSLNLRTTSDTEVLLEAFEKIGIEELAMKIKGQYAFAILDKSTGATHLVRDRFGQAPLYYFSGEEFSFASDIRVLHSRYRHSLTLNTDSIRYYLSELSMPQPYTVWKEIRQLRPAHIMTIDGDGKVVEEKRYWSLDVKQKNISIDEALELTEQRLRSAIKAQSVSDIPFGCFLSGGIDSGLIVSLLAQDIPNLKTYTVGFDYEDFNELADAKLVAERYQTDHQEIKLEIDVVNDLESILNEYGEPFADSSAIPTYYISKEIKKNISVALAGDGGDEMFGGYIDYHQCFGAEQLKDKHPGSLKQNLVGQLSKIGSRISDKIDNLGTELDYLKIETPFQLYRNMGFTPQEKSYFNFDTSFTHNYFDEIWSANETDSMTDTLMRASLHTRLVNDYLVKVDRASMANSLEVRSPFLDHELAELAFSLPTDFKFYKGESKYILKKLGEKYMYPDIFTKKKRGFGIPVKHWLKNELKDLAHDCFSSIVKRDMGFNANISNLQDEHISGKQDHTHRIWSIICLELWFRKYI